jgi:hypothetical protein
MLTSHEIRQLSNKDQIRLALFCANQVRSNWGYLRQLVAAFETIELWLEDKATYEECQTNIMIAAQFWDQGRADEVNAAPYHAINSVLTGENTTPDYVIFAATATVKSADTRFSYEERNAIVQQQIDYYTQLRYVDEILEKIILKGDIYE